MLEIKNITKIYNTGGFKQIALDNINIKFRRHEFVAILGPSGSGKTTLLNIIGGLDHYDSGDLIINETSTKNYNDRAWDSYRNHRVGFVFQSYNLISHQTVLKNVELALTLSGISKEERKKRAIEALKDVGLEQHINKKPNQLSGGQMQRVAIARALVNNPEIILADEPTGALDSDTSVQIMELLKKISEEKLVIMVTHNPELAAIYASRTINIKDGKLISDSKPFTKKDEKTSKVQTSKNAKTSMSFLTALSLSFNNLMTKKGRTTLVSFAGSIGIIGIALILAVSTGFQKYIDSIQEDALTSYPLQIRQESADITGVLLSMTSASGENDNSGIVKEQQYITSMLSNIKSNDLKSLNNYINKNYKTLDEDLSTISYSYSIDPMIYTMDTNNKLSKLNPSNLFSSIYNSNMISSYSSFASIFTQMIDDEETLKQQYDILAGRWPKNYNEMIIVLSEPNGISDLLVYSLGLRDNDELTDMVTKIMSGKEVNIKNDPLELTYEDLMNVKLKLIQPSDTYRYNNNYDVYEDMSNDQEFMKNLYNNSEDLKIVGVITAKPGTTSTALTPGVAYKSDLIKHIIEYSKNQEVVKKQLENSEIDAFTGKRFDSKTNNFDYSFSDLVSVDEKKLQEAFNVKIDQNDLQNKIENNMSEISNSITTDITPAYKLFSDTQDKLIDGLFNSIKNNISQKDVEKTINNYLQEKAQIELLEELSNKYVLPKEVFEKTYSGVLNTLLNMYISSYYAVDKSLTKDETNMVAKIDETLKNTIISNFNNNAYIIKLKDTMAHTMTETLMKKDILEKVGKITTNVSQAFANSFNVDANKISQAFKLNFTEDELTRIVSAMLNKNESSASNNLLMLGYQDLDEPTAISYYFKSFDSKERFMKFIDDYSKKMKDENKEDKAINYADTTGILMSSVKIIVNAVSYVLIAFVSIALIVSSIMIGIITYISVYERTKEIGILRAIGASKKNISSIFNAETFIIGLLAGIFGIGITYLLIPIINTIIHHFTGNIPLNATLNIGSALVLIVLSIILTLIGGLIPASSASKKDPVEALRNE